MDHMGLDENFNPGYDSMKNPRGILSYNLTGYAQSALSWKITGNLGGEQYIDKSRGPLNEGGMYFERQGLHLPNPPLTGNAMYNWTKGDSPIASTSSSTSASAGAGGSPSLKFYVANFTLNLPTPQYDIPISVQFTNTSSNSTPFKFRSLLYVNGYQFGKYVNHIGPQLDYPVPEGILNYQGNNWIGVSIWNMESDNAGGGKLGGLELVQGHAVMSGRGAVALSPMEGWSARAGAY